MTIRVHHYTLDGKRCKHCGAAFQPGRTSPQLCTGRARSSSAQTAEPPVSPPQEMIELAKEVAERSPCRSKRGVVIHVKGVPLAFAHNGPPAELGCPGRAICAGSCGKRSVHAESRALRLVGGVPREVANAYLIHSIGLEMVHVELAADGGVVACGGPSCWQCSREILDVKLIAGVWLYEQVFAMLDTVDGQAVTSCPEPCGARWRRYTPAEFYRVTLQRCGMTP